MPSAQGTPHTQVLAMLPELLMVVRVTMERMIVVTMTWWTA